MFKRNTGCLGNGTVRSNQQRCSTQKDVFRNFTKLQNTSGRLLLEMIEHDHGTIIGTGITCKKIHCYMHDSACRWFVVIKAKIF